MNCTVFVTTHGVYNRSVKYNILQKNNMEVQYKCPDNSVANFTITIDIPLVDPPDLPMHGSSTVVVEFDCAQF